MHQLKKLSLRGQRSQPIQSERGPPIYRPRWSTGVLLYSQGIDVQSEFRCTHRKLMAVLVFADWMHATKSSSSASDISHAFRFLTEVAHHTYKEGGKVSCGGQWGAMAVSMVRVVDSDDNMIPLRNT